MLWWLCGGSIFSSNVWSACSGWGRCADGLGGGETEGWIWAGLPEIVRHVDLSGPLSRCCASPSIWGPDMWGPLLSFSLLLSSCIGPHSAGPRPPSGPDAWPLHLVLLGRIRILGLCVGLGPCGADERVTWHLGCAGWCPSWLWVCLLSFGSFGAEGSSFWLTRLHR